VKKRKIHLEDEINAGISKNGSSNFICKNKIRGELNQPFSWKKYIYWTLDVKYPMSGDVIMLMFETFKTLYNKQRICNATLRAIHVVWIFV